MSCNFVFDAPNDIRHPRNYFEGDHDDRRGNKQYDEDIEQNRIEERKGSISENPIKNIRYALGPVQLPIWLSLFSTSQSAPLSGESIFQIPENVQGNVQGFIRISDFAQAEIGMKKMSVVIPFVHFPVTDRDPGDGQDVGRDGQAELVVLNEMNDGFHAISPLGEGYISVPK